ncbi:MAG: tol-pal system-associated acyl-CoA thioesterase [Algicola sp.]|nr:tol-pal system-associated acyl-CoA thioesterase [Algicola sp.]
MLSKTNYTLAIRVYYEDTDVAGIVYNANYLKFFERARTEWFRELGIEQDVMLAQNIGFVIRKVEMDNLLPSRFNDLLNVHCRISQLRKASMQFAQSITNSAGQTICTATFTVACVNLKKMKPVKLPANITEVLNIVI